MANEGKENKLIHDSLQLSEKLVIKKAPKERGRYPYEQVATENVLQADGSVKSNIRVIDRENNHYKEVTSDTEGNITHFCDEELSKHKGHGSAKKKSGD